MSRSQTLNLLSHQAPHLLCLFTEELPQADGPQLTSAQQEPGIYILLELSSALMKGHQDVKNLAPWLQMRIVRWAQHSFHSFLSGTILDIIPLLSLLSFPGHFLTFYQCLLGKQPNKLLSCEPSSQSLLLGNLTEDS